MRYYFEVMQITPTTPWIAPGGGGTQQSSIQGGTGPEVQPLTQL